MGLEEITKNKEIQGRLKEENLKDSLESKINSEYNSAEKKFSNAGESTTIAAKLYNGFVNAPAGIFNGGHNTLKNSYKFIVSEDYRSEKVKNYIRGRIYKSEQKGRISAARAAYLHGHLDKEKITPYLVDFFVHTAVLNVVGWGPTYILYKYYSAGAISPGDLASLLIFLGPIQRTGWTIGRMVYDYFKREKNGERISFKEKIKSIFGKRSVALVVGTAPYLGGLFGYPAQMIYSEYKTDKELGDFILDDSLHGIEKRMPIVKNIRKKVINKIYKGLIHINTYGTNKNNRNKRVE